MIDLTNIRDVQTIKSNLRTCFEPTSGQEVMKFLEQLCGWYDFAESDPNKIMIGHGKRQVLATIKTLLNSTPEQVVALLTQTE